MAYQTLCHRFSTAGTATAAWATGLAGGLCMGIDPIMGLMSGHIGWVGGVLAEVVAEVALYKNRVGVSRGSSIVQRAGLSGYALTLAGALSLNHPPVEIANKPSDPPSLPEKTISVPDSSPAVAPAPKLS